ncbi:MAG: ATP-binding protein [Planctomycetota bacterium]
MGSRLRAMDWSQTPLGPARFWPQSLKTAVRIMLTSRQPMFVWWGPELINLYNDPYKSIVGGKHPEALGQPAEQVWHEIWDQIELRVDSAMCNNEGTYDESLLLIMERNGYPEETYYTFSYSPIPDDEGGNGGIICANTDDTHRIIGERQLALLRELATKTADARTFDDACARSVRCLESNPRDIPFALIYLVDPEKNCVVLGGTSGITQNLSHIPQSVSLDSHSKWPFAEVLNTHHPQMMTDLSLIQNCLPTTVWPQRPTQAVAVPIAPSGQNGKSGVLIIGLNPFRLFDDSYQAFIDLVAAQISASIANAQAYEVERRRAESLAELDRAKTAFFSNVSHEFRTPLTLMLGPLEDLLHRPEKQLSNDDRELVAIMHRNGQRLLKLVNALLDFSRIEAGGVQAKHEPIDLAALTADLASTFRSAVERGGLKLTIQCPPLSEPVYVDREMWEKIVLNLLSNAYKYTLQGEITVSLRHEGRTAVFSVSDTGTGIKSSDLSKLFHRFHRIEGSQGRTHEGTGIGLALVQELVKLLGGTVTATSDYGRGSTFRVTLPLGCDHLSPVQIANGAEGEQFPRKTGGNVNDLWPWLPVENRTAAERSQTDSMRPKNDIHLENVVNKMSISSRPRIILADDNADMRDYIHRLLAPLYDVTLVIDGRQALAEATAHAPDLVLTDIMMPNLDGIGLLKALRANPRTMSVPVIMLSARAGEEARVEGLEAGADDYLIKPFSAQELLARVSGLLALSKLRQEASENLHESEARFRLMADSAPIMVWMTDTEGSCTFLSKSWYDFTGTTPSESLGFGWITAIHPEDQARLQTEFETASSRQEGFRLEYRIRSRDGSYRWALGAAASRFSPAGRFMGYVGSVVDITDRKQFEDILRETDRRKDEFLATLAHELRNPLAPIRNGLHILRLAKDDREVIAETREMMDRQLQQMIRLIDDLLDVSRISRGKIELRREMMDLKIAVLNAAETSRPLLEQAGHELTIELQPDPVLVYGDVTRLSQAFSNLLNNAAKYTRPGGQIRLRVERDTDHVVISIEDNGIGIPAHLQSSIFEMFMQVDRSLEKSQGGLGVGLTIVKRLVEMHDGAVQVHSDGQDQGSTFVVRLPIAGANSGEDPLTSNNDKSATAENRQRVLVVDDNRDSAQTLAMMLKIMGNDVRTAHDGLEAIERAQEYLPNVILLDLGMPKLNGYDVCRRIREQPWGQNMVIIALTGWGQAEDRQRTKEAGFDHHLVKPVDVGKLKELLDEAAQRTPTSP